MIEFTLWLNSLHLLTYLQWELWSRWLLFNRRKIEEKAKKGEAAEAAETLISTAEERIFLINAYNYLHQHLYSQLVGCELRSGRWREIDNSSQWYLIIDRLIRAGHLCHVLLERLKVEGWRSGYKSWASIFFCSFGPYLDTYTSIHLYIQKMYIVTNKLTLLNSYTTYPVSEHCALFKVLP